MRRKIISSASLLSVVLSTILSLSAIYRLTTTGVPVLLLGANTATPTFAVPMVPTDTVLAFSLRVQDKSWKSICCIC